MGKMSPEDRRDQVLACAQRLFFEKGFERTTVSDLMAEAGVSKGGFYHHFESKDEVLEAVAARLAHDTVARLEDILEEPSMPALERLNAVLLRARQLKRQDAPGILAAFRTVFRPENIVLYHRIHRAITVVLTPLFTRIIEQGQSEGDFEVFDAGAAAEIILHLGTVTHDNVSEAIAALGTDRAEGAAEALERRLRAQGMAIDRILGLPDGSVRYVEPGFVAALFASDNPEPG